MFARKTLRWLVAALLLVQAVALPLAAGAEEASLASFGFSGFDGFVDGRETEVAVTASLTHDGSLTDETMLRYRAMLTDADGLPVTDLVVTYPDVGDDPADPSTWSTLMPDAEGWIYFGPEGGFPLGGVPDLLGSGATTPFRTALAAGSYTLTVEMLDLTLDRSLGTGSIAFTVRELIDPVVHWQFNGFDGFMPGVETEVSVWAHVVDPDAVLAGVPLRYRATVMMDGMPLAGQTIYYPDVGDDPADPTTWSSFTTDENGQAWFGPADGFTVEQLPDLLGDGVTTPFRTTLDAGAYMLTVELMALGEEGPARVGDPGMEYFAVPVEAVTLDISGPVRQPLDHEASYPAHLTNTGGPIPEPVIIRFALQHEDGIAEGDVTLLYRDSATGEFMPLPLHLEDGALMGTFGPSGGFAVPAGYDATTLIRGTFHREGAFAVTAWVEGVLTGETYAMTDHMVTVFVPGENRGRGGDARPEAGPPEDAGRGGKPAAGGRGQGGEAPSASGDGQGGPSAKRGGPSERALEHRR